MAVHKSKKTPRKDAFLTYGLLILSALLLYFGFLTEGCGCYKKYLPSIIAGAALFIYALLRLK
jgi:hypothetical protein